jgi:hypothetical protein
LWLAALAFKAVANLRWIGRAKPRADHGQRRIDDRARGVDERRAPSTMPGWPPIAGS